MAIGERIRFFRQRRGMTMKQLGTAIGFPENSADVRVAQYEAETRTPKGGVTERLANALDVSPAALAIPDIDNPVGLIHTLFALEDRYGLRICENNGELRLFVDMDRWKGAAEIHKSFCSWAEQAQKLATGEITKEEYDRWRYHYPDIPVQEDNGMEH